MRFFRTCLLLLYMITGLCSAPVMAAANAQVLIVLSDESTVHAQAAAEVRNRLTDANIESSQVLWNQLETTTLTQHPVILTLGLAAMEKVTQLETTVPTLASMVTRDAFEHTRALAPNAALYGLVLDQPAERQIATLRAALPDWKRVALITSADSVLHALRLADAAQAQQLLPNIEVISSEQRLFGAMQGLLQPPSVLILLPDRSLYNSRTIQNVLLTTYRYRSPVLGLSAAYSRAGALLSIHSTPEQIAHQSVALVRDLLAHRTVPSMSHPAYFEITVNRAVARSLGINLPPATHIHHLVQQQEDAKGDGS